MQKSSKNKYDSRIKRKAVDLYLNKHYGYKKVAKMLNIPSPSSVKNWVKIYKLEGQQALNDVELGGHKRREKIKYPKPQKIKSGATLQEEVEWLRAENAYLKKLEALVAIKEKRKPRL